MGSIFQGPSELHDNNDDGTCSFNSGLVLHLSAAAAVHMHKQHTHTLYRCRPADKNPPIPLSTMNCLLNNSRWAAGGRQSKE